MNKEFTFRPFETRDIVRLDSIIIKIGLDDMRKCISTLNFRSIAGNAHNRNERNDAIGRAVMTEIICIVLQKLPECENEIYGFLASLSGKTAEEIAKQPPAVTVRMIKEVVGMYGFTDFFTELSGLLTAVKTEK